MEIALVVMGLALLAALGLVFWLFAQRQGESARRSEAETRAATAEAEARAAGEAAGLLRAADDERRSRLSELESELEMARIGLARIGEREEALKAERSRLDEEFAKIARASVSEGHKRLVEMARQVLGAERELSQKEMTERLEAAERKVKPIDESLAKTAQQLVALNERIDNAAKAHSELRQETGKLVRALSRPEVRGRYGEIQLRRVAELAGMSAYCDFTEQTSSRDDAGALLRPDMVVRLPNERVVAVDAKCNIDAYVRAAEASSEADREELLGKFAQDVAQQVRSLSSKKYWDALEQSPEFVVMFVPGDHFLDAALARQGDLLEKAAQQNVILASPSTLIGLLRAVHVGWGEQRLAAQAQELRTLCRELHERAGVFLKHLGETGTALERAVKKYNDAVGSVETRLVPTMRKIEDSGAGSGKEIVEPKPASTLPRTGVQGLLPGQG
ncbi:MAG: DNA recombination protein RmuC [Planctomycetota bacterium]